MKTILFICTHNSARSQMAEGLVNALYSDRFQAFSAGTTAYMVNPFAIEAMREIGIDISKHRSKLIDEFKDTPFDIVVTVCDNARELCPIFPGAKKMIHQSFEDPSSFEGPRKQKLQRFREVRNDIRSWLDLLMHDQA